MNIISKINPIVCFVSLLSSLLFASPRQQDFFTGLNQRLGSESGAVSMHQLHMVRTLFGTPFFIVAAILVGALLAVWLLSRLFKKKTPPESYKRDGLENRPQEEKQDKEALERKKEEDYKALESFLNNK